MNKDFKEMSERLRCEVSFYNGPHTHAITCPPAHPRPDDPARHARRIADTIADTWSNIPGIGTGEHLNVPLAVTALLTLAYPFPAAARPERALDDMGDGEVLTYLAYQWTQYTAAQPAYIERRHPLISWLFPDEDQEIDPLLLRGARAVFETALHAQLPDLYRTAETRYQLDILGDLLQALRPDEPACREGKIHTPLSIGRMLAKVLDPEGGSDKSVLEEQAGTGALVKDLAWQIRQSGEDPRNYRWILNDRDPLAAACLAVNIDVWQLGPKVIVGCDDALDPQWPIRALQDQREAVRTRQLLDLVSEIEELGIQVIPVGFGDMAEGQ